MTLLIFEPASTGHWLTYVRLLVESFSPLGPPLRIVVALSQAAVDTPDFQLQIAPVREGVQIVLMPGKLQGGTYDIARQKLAMLRQVLRQVRPDHVCIPYLDGLYPLMAMSRLGFRRLVPEGVEVEALMMRGGFAYPGRPWRAKLRDGLSRRLLPWVPLQVLHVLDPLAFEALCPQDPAGRFAIRMMPDPVQASDVTDRTEARRRLGLPADGRLLGSGGSMDRRKGIDLLIRAFACAPLNPDDRLLLIGRCEPAIRTLLTGPCAGLVDSGRVIVRDEYVSDAQLELAFAAMDVVCTPYPAHIGSASIVLRGAAAGRFVLGSDYGWVGWAIDRFGLGATCRVTDIDRFAATLKTALDQAPGHGLAEPARRFVAYHTASNFAAHWTARLRQRLGLAPDPRLVSWDSVVETACPLDAVMPGNR